MWEGSLYDSTTPFLTRLLFIFTGIDILMQAHYLKVTCLTVSFNRFYNTDSSFVHGGLKEQLPEEVYGQQQIHQKIMELDFHDCKAKILLVDSHRTLDNGVVVQVIIIFFLVCYI